MKSYILIAILAAFCLAGTNQVNGAAINNGLATSKDSTINFGTALKMYYTSFQRIMPCGYPPLDIPVLAPFTYDFFPINMSNDYYSAVGNVSNLEVTGLNNFRILGGTFNATTNRTTFDVIFPQMQMLGEYEMNAMAILAGFPAKMAGSGLMNYKIIDYRVVCDFVLAPPANNPNSLRISDFNLQFYFGDMIFNNWNTLWDISMNNFVNQMGREVMLIWAQQIQVQIDVIYAQLFLPNINNMLSEVSMESLMDFFVTQSTEFDSANCTLA